MQECGFTDGKVQEEGDGDCESSEGVGDSESSAGLRDGESSDGIWNEESSQGIRKEELEGRQTEDDDEWEAEDKRMEEAVRRIGRGRVARALTNCNTVRRAEISKSTHELTRALTN